MDELLVGIVAQVKLNPQRIRNLSEKQRNNLCVAMQQKLRETSPLHDHFTQLRRNERIKSNNKDAGRGKGGGAIVTAKEVEDESDDERSSDESSSDNSDIEKYFNLENHIGSGGGGGGGGGGGSSAGGGESSMTSNMSRLLKSRRHATPGMTHGHYGIINAFFSDDRDISSSNNNVSTSSCSTPTSSYPPIASSSSSSAAAAAAAFAQTKTNKRDFSSSYENRNKNPISSSQPVTPKKSNLSGAESDTGAEKCINKFSNRTKMFLTSFLKFKRSLRVKRRNSNSCSDLFVI